VALIVSQFAANQSKQFPANTMKQLFAITVFAIAGFTLLETWI
jgi:hypothetical protein